MRKTTKALMIAGTGTVFALGLFFGTGSFEADAINIHSGVIPKKVEIEAEPKPDIEEILREQQQERINQEVAAERAALVAEGSKAENKTVDGVESQVKGLYLLDNIKGMSIVPNKEYYAVDDHAADLSKVEIIAYETDASKSPAAIEAAKEVAAIYNTGAVVGPSVNIQYKGLEEGSNLRVVGDYKFGIDESFAKDGSKYAVVAIFPGGFYRVYEDVDDNPATISIKTASNYDHDIAMYTLIRVD